MAPVTFKRWNIRKSTSTQAQASLITHQFRRGHGYFEFAPNSELLRRAPHLALHNGPKRDGKCLPPDGTSDRSIHWLRPPGGHQPLMCAWIASEKAWMPTMRDGKRMAFTAEYLASHGWTYLKAA